MATHSSTLAWKIPWAEEPSRLQSMGSWMSDKTQRLHFHFSLSCIGKGNGNPLQCSCLESPRDGGAWWAAVYGVAQSQTRLIRLSSSSSSSKLLAWWFPCTCWAPFRFLGVDLDLDPWGSCCLQLLVSITESAARFMNHVRCTSLSRESWKVPWFSPAPPHLFCLF